MEILENVKMAFSALLANKLRSSLTMLGIAIGNASVIAMVAVGQGAQKLAAEQFASLGPNVLFVSLSSARIRRTSSDQARPLVFKDAEAIAQQVSTVTAVAPEIQGTLVIAYGNQRFNNPTIGTTPEYLTVRHFKIAQGRFLNDIDLRRNNRVVVLGAAIAQRLFAQQNPIGQLLRINNTSFEVVGVLAAKGSLFGADQDDKAIVPLTTMSNQLVGHRSVYGVPLSLISILARDEQSVKAAQFQIKNLLQLRHPESRDDDIKISPQNDLIAIANETNEGLTRMLAAIASISLLVGGIGVMNIMLVSVTERTQEIGLRKALGAREQDILVQFLIEAVILATMGGITGILVGVGGVTVASQVSALATSLSPVSIVVAVGVSGAIGLFFGVIPAQRAANLDPIVALRQF
jgi:putative ABC transport system permease protein